MKERMKILIVSQYWEPENGVPQRRWAWLSGLLESEGHEITVIAPLPHYHRKITIPQLWKEHRFHSSIPQKENTGNVRIVRSGFVPSGSSITGKTLNQASVALASMWVLVKRLGVLRNYQPDLVIGTVPALPTALVTWVAAKVFRVPFVIDLRDAWPDLFANSNSWNRGTGHTSLREKVLSRGALPIVKSGVGKALYFVLRNASGIMLTSEFFERSLKQNKSLRNRAKALPMLTVRNVFPAETQFTKSSQEIEVVSPDERSLNVLYAGTLGRAQNLHNAIRAFRIAKDNGVEVTLRFVGAGAQKRSLVESARELGVQVIFESRREAGDLADLYQWADTALVHLTDWDALTKAVPSKLYELMTVGIHVSGVVSGETRELIEKLHAGHVVDPENPEALATLWCRLADNRELLKISHEGRDWVIDTREKNVPKALKEFLREVVRKEI